MTYKVSSYDNFHMYDEDDGPDEHGEFDLATEALAKAREIVEQSLRHNAKDAKSVQDLIDRYQSFGDAPSIRGEPNIEFSASRYAAEIAPVIFAEKQDRAV